MNHEIVIVAATRTALGSFGGSLSSIPAHKLGAEVIASLLKKTGVNKDQIDEVILGQVLTAGSGQNPARQAAIEAGLPYQTPSMTINKVCGSGLKAVQLAFQAIACGDAEIVIAGGQESMSLSSHVLPKSREGKKMGPWTMVDTMVVDGLWCAFNDCHMGVTAENIATKFDYSRKSQDEFALESQQKTEAAQKSDLFRNEITPISIPQRRGDDIIFDSDEFPRHSSSMDSLANLRPAFAKDGTVTAGNASGINDGAAAVMVMSASKAQELKLEPMARIVSYSSAGVDPSIMGTGPIPASTKCLEKAGWKASELDRIEANEAFAAQAMSVNDSLGWDKSKVNVTGGSISLGHPIGASGARILVTLLHGMERDKVNKGLATMCIGGGMGVAIAVERVN
ncbi:MAG: acetyl-CoA C-acetyltransferase [Gammaproteobacteria bacterium]|jgi:acetyl-CoA C-acetyltransferase|nr:acetyl-CoA C-acetyltransferase [Gammaproteobacteria bacterium]MBT5548263.1 acetyl-CoA C-acetyltransferase [Gammaproteobacteria bacterium]MBT5978976.1 acetyl-CoA C-acetyltransferase [Gammaproteobacteria bacterium]MBT8009731.1 acetyl-CoA C-acetyltransferase [Gammaproteobacteria bacterium]